jgi:hypothetical protein
VTTGVTVQALVGSSRPWRRQNFDSRWRSRIRFRRAPSRAPKRSRAASTSGAGTWIGSSSPPASSHASLRASRGSILTRSPGRCGTSPGATTRAVDPLLDQVPVEPETGRARLVAAARRRPTAQDPLDRLPVLGQRPLLEQLVGANGPRRCPEPSTGGTPRLRQDGAVAPPAAASRFADESGRRIRICRGLPGAR